jgi:hypothetical protein
MFALISQQLLSRTREQAVTKGPFSAACLGVDGDAVRALIEKRGVERIEQ